MTGDCHVQFGERLEGKFLWPTQLDFSYDVPFKTNRSERREISLIIKKIFHHIEKKTDSINISVDLKGSDESRQYNGELTYKSQVTSDQGSIKFEVSLRVKLLDNLSKKNAKTLTQRANIL